MIELQKKGCDQPLRGTSNEIPSEEGGSIPSHHSEKIQEKIMERSLREIGNDQTLPQEIMANLFKAYAGEEDKYSGLTTDNFQSSYTLLLERCDQASILKDNTKRAYSIMLTGAARKHCIDLLKLRMLLLEGLVLAIKIRFLTFERNCVLLREQKSYHCEDNDIKPSYNSIGMFGNTHYKAY